MASTIYERFVDNFNMDNTDELLFHMELWNLRLKNDKDKEVIKLLQFIDGKDVNLNKIEIENKTNKEILLQYFSVEELNSFGLDNNWLENKLKHVQI